MAPLPVPLLLRKAGLKGSGFARRAAASPGCPGPYCSARRGLWARALPGGSCFAWLPEPLLLRKAGLRARAAPGGSCFAWLPEPLLLRKAGLRAGLRPEAAASLGCPGPFCSARRGLRANSYSRISLRRRSRGGLGNHYQNMRGKARLCSHPDYLPEST